MPVLYARAAATRGGNNQHWTAKLSLAGALLATLMAAGCSVSPPLPRAAAAADADIAVPAARYSSVTAPYTPQRPVEPLPWREQNDRVAPQARP